MGDNDSLSSSLATSSLLYIVITIVCIGLAWWALQQLRLDLFLRQPKSGQSKMLQILLSVALGYEAARFLIDYFNWSALLKGMF
ncbi:MAG: DUF1146 domain-containing protein [Paenibacillaceae bacterium]|uniref:DUF1146 family protein n=1 Tax=Paenibacillus cymbidii TaxID=1639034 RepID=UPI0010815CC7|nr:DUF1146 family protein [Paenibacillus cymbidii]MBO9604836.1 DUF1146 domain-containing protein [Paenibacillaceae bacterium]